MINRLERLKHLHYSEAPQRIRYGDGWVTYRPDLQASAQSVQAQYRSHRSWRRNAIMAAAIIIGLDAIAVIAVLLLLLVK